MHVSTPAKPVYRSQRCGHVALVLLLCYACDELGVQKESFVPQIETTNQRSLRVLNSALSVRFLFLTKSSRDGVSSSMGQIQQYS